MRRETVIVRRVYRSLPAPVVVPVAAEPEPLIWDESLCCEALRIRRSTLALWRSEGLPYIKRGRIVLFIAADVVEWLRTQYERNDEPIPIRRSA